MSSRMKLLFDENLSPKLPGLLATHFPDSAHIRECGLLGQGDEDIWEHARTNGFTIVSKDSDFQQRALLYGHPPKLVWLRIGNCTKTQLVQLIITHAEEINALDTDPFESVLVLS
jgi:predicted nuclease of predicted toxin-antitoxin system